MKQITRREAIEALKGMFETNTGQKENLSRVIEYDNDTATFMLDKRKYLRCEVIGKLREYFKDVNIADGLCSIGSISIAFTFVTINARGRQRLHIR